MLGEVLSFISVSFLLIFMQGCKPSLPSDILSRGEMEDVMYDYHLSKSLASQQGNPGEWERIYEDAVLRKHGITQEQFDRSLTYYMRHTDELSKIYDKLEDRLRAEAGSLGVSTSELGSLGTLGATGDTANVWSETRSLTLIPQAPFNQKSFVIKCDTSYHAGDAFALAFDCNFIYQDGMRNACVLLAITLTNDSIVSSFTQVSMPCHQTVNLSDYGRVGIKEIRGYFILSKSQSQLESATTLQLMFINNIQLVRMHSKLQPATLPDDADTSEIRPVNVPPIPRKPLSLPQSASGQVQQIDRTLKVEPTKLK